MRNGLYQVEVLARQTADGGKGVDGMALITNHDGLFFVKLHPVKLAAKPKPKGKTEYVTYVCYPSVSDTSIFFRRLWKKSRKAGNLINGHTNLQRTPIWIAWF